MPQDQKKVSELQYSREAINSLLLWASGQPIDIVELQRRISIALDLMLAFLAVPLAKLILRAVACTGIFFSLIYFSYENIRKSPIAGF